MENRPLFIDEDDFLATEKEPQADESTQEPEKEAVVEQEKTEPVHEERKEEPVVVSEKEEDTKPILDEPKEEIVTEDSELNKPVEEKKIEQHSPKEKKSAEQIKTDISLIATILLSIFVGYFFLRTAYGFYLGFRYFDYAHGNNTSEVQK